MLNNRFLNVVVVVVAAAAAAAAAGVMVVVAVVVEGYTILSLSLLSSEIIKENLAQCRSNALKQRRVRVYQ